MATHNTRLCHFFPLSSLILIYMWNKLNSPIRLVRVVNPPVVPHPNICRAGVVAHIALIHLLHSTFCVRRQMKQMYNSIHWWKSHGNVWQQRHSGMEGKPWWGRMMSFSICVIYVSTHFHILTHNEAIKHVLPSSVTRSASSTMVTVSVSGVRAAMSLLKLWCSLSWFLSWL